MEFDLFQIFESIRQTVITSDIVTRSNYYFAMLQIISGILSTLFVGIIIIVLMRHNRLRADDRQNHMPSVDLLEKTREDENADWERVLKHARSINPSDWKLAIIEADTMLDTMTKTMGFPGDTLGERLKAIDPADFDSLQDAWDAHKIRNSIAHQTGFVLTQREVTTVINKYEKVFKEFSYI